MNIHDKKLEQILTLLGWQIDCYGPLEISCPEREAFACRYAAEVVIDSLMKEVVDVVLMVKRDKWLKKPSGLIHEALGLTESEYLNWANFKVLEDENKFQAQLDEFISNPKDYQDEL